MFTKKRRKEVAKMAFVELGKILRFRGVDTDETTSFTQEDMAKAMLFAGVPRVEREEFLAELDAAEGFVN